MAEALQTVRSSLDEQGYAVIPQALSHEQISLLRDAASRTASLARAGHWPYIRTVPKQFPPWPNVPGEGGIWGVQHLLHPDLEDADCFADLYFGDIVMQKAKEAMDLTDSDESMLVMELFNMLVRPDQDFQLRWHRDDVSFAQSVAEEERAMGLVPGQADDISGLNGSSGHTPRLKKKRRPFHTQYNIPLYHDPSLHVVPGSHRRGRTQEEARLLEKDPYVPTLPGMVEVKMLPGDIVFYDNDIIHRGVYNSKSERLTLHGSVGDLRGGDARARNVLQHGVREWVEKCDFSGLLEPAARERAESMRKSLLMLGDRAGDVGFSHHD